MPTKPTQDAIALLKADHRTVAALFKKFEQTSGKVAQAKLAHEICKDLIIHTIIEEEVFYPGVKDAVKEDLEQEAYVEHDAAKAMIAEILADTPEDDFYEAKVTVLGEMIKHHVKEEEQPGGMFAQARRGDTDLRELGRVMAARKKELVAQFKKSGLPPPETKVMVGGRLTHSLLKHI